MPSLAAHGTSVLSSQSCSDSCAVWPPSVRVNVGITGHRMRSTSRPHFFSVTVSNNVLGRCCRWSCLVFALPFHRIGRSKIRGCGHSQKQNLKVFSSVMSRFTANGTSWLASQSFQPIPELIDKNIIGPLRKIGITCSSWPSGTLIIIVGISL